MILIQVTGQKAEIAETELLVSGSVNTAEVGFSLSAEWANLTPTAVFRAGAAEISVALFHGRCFIPWEVLVRDNVGLPLYIGVYGVAGETTVMPTVWVKAGVIREGTEQGDNALSPTPDVYQQFVNEIAEDARRAEASAVLAQEKAEAAQSDSVSAGSSALVSQEAARRSEEARDIVVEAEGVALTAAQSAGQFAAQAEAAITVTESAKEETVSSAREAAVAAGSASGDATRAAASSTVALSAERSAKESAGTAKEAETAASNAAKDAVNAWNQIKGKTVVTVERNYPTAPQIDLTVEEATQAIAITDIGGIPLQNFDFTEMRFYCENVPQTAADNSELRVALNRSASAMYTAATGFLVSTSQLYTSGAVSLKDGTAWTADAQTNRAWRGAMNVQIYPNLEYGRVVRSVNFWSNNTLIPVGTKIQVWLR